MITLTSILTFVSGSLIGGFCTRQVRRWRQQRTVVMLKEPTPNEPILTDPVVNAPVLEEPTPNEPVLVESTPDEPVDVPEAKEDNLQQIAGIGRVYAKRLQAAGIRSFADLAQRTPQEIVAFVTASGTPQPNVEPWIIDAARLAAA